MRDVILTRLARAILDVSTWMARLCLRGVSDAGLKKIIESHDA